MLDNLVIVESPAKAKTLSIFLGADYKVIASYGHVRDLVSKSGSVDPNDHFKMIWAISERGKKQIHTIQDTLKKVKNLYLATDPDREGEAISWHILEILKQNNLLNNKTIKRVVFHEITKAAVSEAFNNPRELDSNLVRAYLARRILDYLVGFSLSPVLWRKMPGAKSAGRVQSVALRLIVERELEIKSFKSEEYWSLHNKFNSKNGEFISNVIHIDGKKLDKLGIRSEEEAESIRKDLEIQEYVIENISKKSVSKNSYAPFTTSTLQQDASHKLGFSTKYTMQLAQKLYEGITMDGNTTGLITYMRTDSTNLSEEAINSSRKYIEENLGKDYLPTSPKVYKTKTKNAQEAHEAIRPTSCTRTPESIQDFLQPDEFKLYELIWKRTIASQMSNAKFNQVSINIKSKDDKYKLKSTGSTLVFDGFLKVYDDSSNDKLNVEKLPPLKESDSIDLNEANKAQHFTQPPARFTEASLVKKLEELGIGRPSTYATIINVIQERKYVILQKKTFIPENIGIFTVSFLKNFFEKYVEYKFTADMEEELDDISNGKINWEVVLNNFWEKFNNNIVSMNDISVSNVIDTLEKDIHEYIFKNVKNNGQCPECGIGKMGLKLSKYGAFLGCSNYPDCKYIMPIGDNNTVNSIMENNKIVALDTKTNDNILFKTGRYGAYLEWEHTIDKAKNKPKRLSIPKFINDPDELTQEDILTLINLPKILGKNPIDNNDVVLYLGRFGPYLSCGNKTYRLGKSIESLRMDLDKAMIVIKSQ